MEFEPGDKYYPIVSKLGELIQKYNEEYPQPTTQDELNEEAKRRREEYQAAAAEIWARGEFNDFVARYQACKTDEERCTLAVERTNAIAKEVMRRRAPEYFALQDQFLDQLEQDGRLEEFLPNEGPEEGNEYIRKEIREFRRKKRLP